MFGGITDRLIPLFAVGAFLSFTLSQAGMAAHWHRERRGGVDRLRLWINGVGAAATGVALAIILAAKFTEGAWLTVVIIPLTLLMLRAIHRYYQRLDRQLLQRARRRRWSCSDYQPPRLIIPIARWDRVARNAVWRSRCGLSPDVTALHCTELEGPDAEEHEKNIRAEWEQCVEAPARAAGLPVPELVVRSSPYRSVLGPLLRLIDEHGGCAPGPAPGRGAAAAGGEALVGGDHAHPPRAAAAGGAAARRRGGPRGDRRALAAGAAEPAQAAGARRSRRPPRVAAHT